MRCRDLHLVRVTPYSNFNLMALPPWLTMLSPLSQVAAQGVSSGSTIANVQLQQQRLAQQAQQEQAARNLQQQELTQRAVNQQRDYELGIQDLLSRRAIQQSAQQANQLKAQTEADEAARVFAAQDRIRQALSQGQDPRQVYLSEAPVIAPNTLAQLIPKPPGPFQGQVGSVIPVEGLAGKAIVPISPDDAKIVETGPTELEKLKEQKTQTEIDKINAEIDRLKNLAPKLSEPSRMAMNAELAVAEKERKPLEKIQEIRKRYENPRPAQGGYQIGKTYNDPSRGKMTYLGGPPDQLSSWQINQ